MPQNKLVPATVWWILSIRVLNHGIITESDQSEELPQLQRLLVLLAPEDPCGNDYRSTGTFHKTTWEGIQSPIENCHRRREHERKGKQDAGKTKGNERYSRKPSNPAAKAREGFVINPALEVLYVSDESIFAPVPVCSVCCLPYHHHNTSHLSG